jgi:hypothetical protein
MKKKKRRKGMKKGERRKWDRNLISPSSTA